MATIFLNIMMVTFLMSIFHGWFDNYIYTFGISISKETNTELINKITNKQTDQSHQCSPNRFKYLSLILSSIKHYKNKYKMITSHDIDKYINTYTILQHNQNIRLKIVNNTLYIPSNINIHDDGIFMVLSYFHRLVLKYGKYIQNTDFIFAWGCQAAKQNTYVKESNWLGNNFPIFISEGSSLNESDNLYPLYLVSRGWLIFAHHRQELWQIECWHRNNIHASKWEDKFNVIEFRGSVNGAARLPIVKKIIDTYGKPNLAIKKGYNIGLVNGGSDRKYQLGKQNLSQEFMHKYILMVDGYSVRDAFHRQSMYRSVIFKDRSVNKEWWYYDLIDNHTVIYYDNVDHLIEMIDEKIEIVNQWENNKNAVYMDKYFHLKNIAENMYEYYKRELWDIANIDCFVIHMLQIYNKYLYNASTVQINQNDDTEFCFHEKCKHFRSGFFQREYEFEASDQWYCKYDNITDKSCHIC